METGLKAGDGRPSIADMINRNTRTIGGILTQYICSYCNQKIRNSGDGEEISHGICPECYHHFKAQMGIDLTEYLDFLNYPVVLVDGDVVIKAANRHAKVLLDREESGIVGFRGGEVFECMYSHLPGGCGRSTHCSGCAIRRAVEETFESDKPVHNRIACIRRDPYDETMSIDMFISTRKAGEMVFLQVIPVSGRI